MAGFMIIGNSTEEVKRKITYANLVLKVLDKDGNDIMRHDLY